MTKRNATMIAAVLTVAALAGCSAAPYDERMKFLDKMSAEGIKYRGQLQQQATPPNKAACEIGWKLLAADPPYDSEGFIRTPEWEAQVQESYIKACITGESLPKPDPSGVNARTVVPFSGSPAPQKS